MTTVAIVYHSGFGHTAVVANALAEGVTAGGGEARLLRIENAGQDFTALLEDATAADAIVFGAPTYMGDVSAALKAFFEASSKHWGEGKWRDKVAGGFTNSLSLAGDKSNSLGSIFTFAMQHGMIWAGVGTPPGNANGNTSSAPEKVNRLGYFTGLATQSDNASPEVTPTAGDREAARLYGMRIAKVASKLKS